MNLAALFSGYPALTRHLLPALERGRNAATHPLVSRLSARGMVGAHAMRVLDMLVASAEPAARFDRLIRKLAGAPNPAAFWSAVIELTVISRLVRVGAMDVGVVPTEDAGRPDAVATLAGHNVYFEVTRLTGVNPQQREQNGRLAALAASVEAIESPFYVTFVPAGPYDDAGIAEIVSTIRTALAAVGAAGTLAAGAAETFTFASPPFGMYVSLKGARTSARPGTRFRLSGAPVFESSDRRDERKLLDTIVGKYRQCVAGALNVIVIHNVSDGLDEAAQTLQFLAESPRSNLSAVVLLSSWAGRSRVLPNADARPAATPLLLETLEAFCDSRGSRRLPRCHRAGGERREHRRPRGAVRSGRLAAGRSGGAVRRRSVDASRPRAYARVQKCGGWFQERFRMGRTTAPGGFRAWLHRVLQALASLLKSGRSCAAGPGQAPLGAQDPGDAGAFPRSESDVRPPAPQPVFEATPQAEAEPVEPFAPVPAPAVLTVVHDAKPSEAVVRLERTLATGTRDPLSASLSADLSSPPDLQAHLGAEPATDQSPVPSEPALVPEAASVLFINGSPGGGRLPEPGELDATAEAGSEPESGRRVRPGPATLAEILGPISAVPDTATPCDGQPELAGGVRPGALVSGEVIAATCEAGALTPVAAGTANEPPLPARLQEAGTSSAWTEPRGRTTRPQAPNPNRTPGGPRVAPTIGSRSGTRVAPEKRGGRPTGPSATRQPSVRATQVERVQPALVCWRIGMLGWGVGLDLPSDRSWCVRQGDWEIAEDDAIRGRYALEDPLAGAIVDDPEGMLAWSHLPTEPFRPFRLSKRDSGRRALTIPGAYRLLVVVPDNWSRDPGTVASEQPGYVHREWRAHHFHKGTVPVFLRPDATVARCLHFGLEGDSEIWDDCFEHGPLFGGDPPRLVAISGFQPARVVLIDEDTRRRCWDDNSEALCRRLRERSVGRFSARIYDAKHFKVQVLPFRYSARLTSVVVDSGPATPGPERHAPASISFRHDAGCTVRGKGSAADLPVVAGAQGSQVSVPLDPHLDGTEWQITHDGGCVSLRLRLQRVWWALASEDDDGEPAWSDGALSLAPELFDPRSCGVVRVRLPWIGWAARIQIGFREDGARGMERVPKRREMRLPLRNLSGCLELDAPPGSQVPLRLWLWHASELLTATVGVVAFPDDVATTTPSVTAAISPPAHVAAPVRLHPSLHVPAPAVARMLTRLRRHGTTACRKLVRHVRAGWRGRHKRWDADFVAHALCVLAVVAQEEEKRDTVAKAHLPHCQKWQRRAEEARATHPDLFTSIEKKYRVLAEGEARRRAPR